MFGQRWRRKTVAGPQPQRRLGRPERFVVDQCVPAEVAGFLRHRGHRSWTAYDANLQEASDAELQAYCANKRATLVTTNRDSATLARRLRACRLVFLAVIEP